MWWIYFDVALPPLTLDSLSSRQALLQGHRGLVNQCFTIFPYFTIPWILSLNYLIAFYGIPLSSPRRARLAELAVDWVPCKLDLEPSWLVSVLASRGVAWERELESCTPAIYVRYVMMLVSSGCFQVIHRRVFGHGIGQSRIHLTPWCEDMTLDCCFHSLRSHHIRFQSHATGAYITWLTGENRTFITLLGRATQRSHHMRVSRWTVLLTPLTPLRLIGLACMLNRVASLVWSGVGLLGPSSDVISLWYDLNK